MVFDITIVEWERRGRFVFWWRHCRDVSQLQIPSLYHQGLLYSYSPTLSSIVSVCFPLLLCSNLAAISNSFRYGGTSLMNMVGKKCACPYYNDIDMISNLM